MAVMPGNGVGHFTRLLALLFPFALVLAVLPPSAALPTPDFDRPDTWFDDHVYHHHADLTTELQELQSSHPAFMTMTTLGSSVRGRELWCVRISDPAVPIASKRQVYVDGEHHGNEYLSGELAILLIHHLLEDREDPQVRQVLDTTVVWVTPMLNPDGNTRDTRSNANGIDLNRHYPFEFTPGGSHGDAPATEPEVAGNVEFMGRTDLDLYLTLHTGVLALIYPWGFTGDPCPDQPMFERFRELVESYGIRYGQAYHELYETHGSSKDFAYGALGVPGFTYEVDGQQTNQISRREDIASRLSDELELIMELIAATPLMNADVAVTAIDVPTSVDEDEGLDVRLELGNPSYTPANNTTVTVEVREGARLIGVHSALVDVPGEGNASVVVDVGLGGVGTYDLRVLVEHPQILWENATNETFQVGTFTVEVASSGLGATSATWGVLLLLLALGAAAALWARQRGWRPGWLLHRVRGVGA